MGSVTVGGKRTNKIEQLILAAVSFFWCFLMWFSTAAFSAAIIEHYNLSRAEFAVLASSAIWLAPIGRVIAGFLADKIGAHRTFPLILTYTGIACIASSFVEDYNTFFWLRVIVASAGISFVVGIQHVAQWFEEHEIGTAEGLYAGTGNVGAGVGAMMLPRIYGTDYKTAFIHLGIVAFILAGLYILRGVPARSEEIAARAKKHASLKRMFYIFTRWGAIALMLQYAMSFGYEIALNAWLPGYYKLGFEEELRALGYTTTAAMGVAAGTFAAVQSFNASLWRPFSGFISDMFQKHRWMPWPFLNKTEPWAPRLHWVFTSMVLITILSVALTIAGRTHQLIPSVLILAVLGFCISTGTGSCFGLVPILFKKYPGIATGFIGGISTSGGIIYPLVFGSVENIHDGYAAVAIFMFIPFMLWFIFAFGRFRKRVTGDEGLGSKESWGLVEEEKDELPVDREAEAIADIEEMRKKERWLVWGMFVLGLEAAIAVFQTIFALFMALTGRGGIGGH